MTTSRAAIVILIVAAALAAVGLVAALTVAFTEASSPGAATTIAGITVPIAIVLFLLGLLLQSRARRTVAA